MEGNIAGNRWDEQLFPSTDNEIIGQQGHRQDLLTRYEHLPTLSNHVSF